jgi:hypothetical protein
VLVVALALVAALAGGGPFAVVFACVWVLVAFCRGYSRNVPGASGFRYHLSTCAVNYLIPVGVATAFYVLLSVYLSWFGDALSLDWLIAMQRTFEDISTFFAKTFKLSELEVLTVLVGIYLLSVLLLSGRDERKRNFAAENETRFRTRVVTTMHRGVDVYGKYSGAVAVGLATLASFTFFGMHLGEPSKDIQLRVKVAQQGYADIAKRAQAELSQHVSTNLYGKVKAAFPPSYQDALGLPGRIDAMVADVRQHADNARSSYDVTIASVEGTVRRETARINKVGALASELRIEAGDRPGTPGNLTYDRVESVRDGLPRQKAEGTELVQEGHKRVTLQAEKLVGERIMALTKPLIQAVPVLEPLLQTFAEAADRTLQERLGKAYDRVLAAVLRDPRTLNKTVDREAKAVVAATDVQPLARHATPQAQQRIDALRLTMSSLAAAEPLIDRRVTAEISRRSSARLSELPDLSLEWPRLPELPQIYLPPPESYSFDRYRPDLYGPSGSYRPPELGGYGGEYGGSGRIAPPKPPVVPEVPRIVPFW